MWLFRWKGNWLKTWKQNIENSHYGCCLWPLRQQSPCSPCVLPSQTFSTSFFFFQVGKDKGNENDHSDFSTFRLYFFGHVSVISTVACTFCIISFPIHLPHHSLSSSHFMQVADRAADTEVNRTVIDWFTYSSVPGSYRGSKSFGSHLPYYQLLQ